jgi:hypothetical protein
VEELVKAIAALMGYANREEVVKLLHKEAQPLAQHFITMGHGIATESFKAERGTLESAKTKAEADLAKANTELETLRKDKPDIAALQAQHQKAVEELKADHQKELGKQKERVSKTLIGRDIEKIKAKLVAKGVKPYIAGVLAKDPDIRDRIKHDDSDNTTVFQAGTRTPYSVAAGQDSLDPLVEELFKTVDADGMSADDIDTGSGSSGHGDDSGETSQDTDRESTTPVKGKAARFENIRKDAEAKAKAPATNLQEARKKKFG